MQLEMRAEINQPNLSQQRRLIQSGVATRDAATHVGWQDGGTGWVRGLYVASYLHTYIYAWMDIGALGSILNHTLDWNRGGCCLWGKGKPLARREADIVAQPMKRCHANTGLGYPPRNFFS